MVFEQANIDIPSQLVSTLARVEAAPLLPLALSADWHVRLYYLV